MVTACWPSISSRVFCSGGQDHFRGQDHVGLARALDLFRGGGPGLLPGPRPAGRPGRSGVGDLGSRNADSPGGDREGQGLPVAIVQIPPLRLDGNRTLPLLQRLGPIFFVLENLDVNDAPGQHQTRDQHQDPQDPEAPGVVPRSLTAGSRWRLRPRPAGSAKSWLPTPGPTGLPPPGRSCRRRTCSRICASRPSGAALITASFRHTSTRPGSSGTTSPSSSAPAG